MAMLLLTGIFFIYFFSLRFSFYFSTGRFCCIKNLLPDVDSTF